MGETKYKPEEYQEIIDRLCAWLSQGKTLRAFSREDGNPSNVRLYAYINTDSKFIKQVARAREVGYDEIAEECFDIADEKPDKGEDGKVDNGYVSWQKNRIWTRTQLLKCWSPKKYGDKQQLEHSGPSGTPIQVLTSVPDTDLTRPAEQKEVDTVGTYEIDED